MPRNLLPRLREHPNPANIPVGTVGEWTTIASPSDLSKLHVGALPTDDLRTRVQSIPSPWARLQLFRVAMEDPQHPARRLVENELLDALEFLWSQTERPNSPLDYQTISLLDLESAAIAAGSERVEWFGNALRTMRPLRVDESAPAMDAITVVLVDGRPILATSPYTLLFTAEDASLLEKSQTGHFFRYATGSDYRRLVDRPRPFQRYVAQVVLPQLQSASGGDADVGVLQQTIKKWLADSVVECKKLPNPSELDPPAGGDWRARAATLGLSQDSSLRAGLQLFKLREGAQMESSPWLLRQQRNPQGQPPLILDEKEFDGFYYPGAAKVALDPSYHTTDRTTLPGTATKYPWVSPLHDWFADKLLVLTNRLQPETSYGFRNFSSHYGGDAAHLSRPQFALPLKREVLQYFSAKDLDERLTMVVSHQGDVEVLLRVPVSNGADIEIRKRYDESAIFQQAHGPDVALWPRFSSESWSDYLVFRRDHNAQIAGYVTMKAVSAGKLIAMEGLQRNQFVHVAGTDTAPEALEFSSPQVQHLRLGLLLPRYGTAASETPKSMQVGVDFGTSNTVVSVRADDKPAAILRIEDLTLQITESSQGTKDLLDAYFFPHALKNEPFGSAVVRHKALSSFNMLTQKPGIRVNIPFAGHVQTDSENAVVGDLKWSNSAESNFLSASFLRHLFAVILAEALRQGVRPQNLHVYWSYPRAFTTSQQAALDGLWQQVSTYFSAKVKGLRPISIGRDESDAVLHYFFNAGLVSTAGDVNVIVDVGGGTSDIAMYGRGAALAFDSIALGGRNLSGPRLQVATAEQAQNPFVARFVEWSDANHLRDYPLEHAALHKYLNDNQYHLAFTYLLRSEWFARHGQPFAADGSCHAFQGMVFYFFSAILYYVGLSLRGIAEKERAADGRRRFIPATVTLAGNGSRYLNWLADLSTTLPAGFGAFNQALSRMVIEGMTPTAADSPVGLHDAKPPRLDVTTEPKLEVAYGLVAAEPLTLDRSKTLVTPVVGEQIQSRGAGDVVPRRFSVTTRISEAETIAPGQVAGVFWEDGEMEIERFHRSYLTALSSLANVGQHWAKTATQTRTLFGELDRRELQQSTRSRLQYVAQQGNGFQGSLFALEVSVVLDRMLGSWFR